MRLSLYDAAWVELKLKLGVMCKSRVLRCVLPGWPWGGRVAGEVMGVPSGTVEPCGSDSLQHPLPFALQAAFQH